MADSDEEGDVYQFVAGGDACERCAALDGSVWHAPPNPPHAHCACEVKLKPKGHHRPRECGDNYWTMESLPDGTVHYGTDNSFEWGFLVTIDCWDGGAYSFEIWVDMGRDADYAPTPEGFNDMEAYAWSEIHDQAEEVMAQTCRPCPDLIVS